MARTKAESYLAHKQWQADTYTRYTVKFRKEEDADLIRFIDRLKSKGLQPTEIFRYAMQLYLNDYEKNHG